MSRVCTHLMFQGDAARAIDLYRQVFPDFRVVAIEHYPETEGKAAGLIRSARIDFDGHPLIFIDSPISHDFGFTASTSLCVEFDSSEMLEAVFLALSEGGEVKMPVDDYGFSRRFGWLTDRFGVSWQLDLPHPSDA
jgi:predicted 3-demethylubiquinone-9 3-methyltransferase (glyoxalase superfamily)